MNNTEQLSFLDAPSVANDYIWRLADGYPKSNGLKVFSCFSCGGGSTMGYKLAGCDVIGNLEIDPKINEIYKANHKPKYSYCMDIRYFNKIPNNELPDELFKLDILDGSPPCSTFSMSGARDKYWGVEKKFKEGQARQVLDELPFVFLDTVAKLRPRYVIMENVTGLLYGDAFKYVQRIYMRFYELGYNVRHFVLNSNLGDTYKRIGEKERNYNQRIVFPGDVMTTIITRRIPIRGHDLTYVPIEDIITASTSTNRARISYLYAA